MFTFIRLFCLTQKSSRLGSRVTPVRGKTRSMAVSSNKLTFNVATFNLLAPCHKRLNKDQHYNRKSRWPRREIDLPELFTPRTEELLAVIKAAGPLDVLCLQEFSTDPRVVDMFNDALGSKYNLLQLPRPCNDEGLAIFIDKSINIVRTVTQDLSGMSCRVALHALLQVPSLQTKVLVSTTHLEFQHHFMSEKIRQAQVKEILSCTRKLCSEYSVGNDSLVFIMGDFNGPPETGSYNLLTEASFISAHSRVHGLEPRVTHRDHRGNEFTADYIFYNSLCPHTRPIAADIYPKQYGTEKWPEQFTASDHRLLVAHFEIDQDQLRNVDNDDDDSSCNITQQTTQTHQNKENKLCSVL